MEGQSPMTGAVVAAEEVKRASTEDETSPHPAKKLRLETTSPSALDTAETSETIAVDNDTHKQSREFPRIREVDVGITEYVDATIPGFSGVIKQRYSDFIVNEVDQDGQVVYLTQLTPPELAVEKDEDQTRASPEEISADMKKVLDDETIVLLHKLLESNGSDPTFVLTKPVEDKQKRTEIHNFFKKYYGDKLVTETSEKSIRIRFKTKKDLRDKRNRPKDLSWDSLGGQFCSFSLYKENRDTMEAINLICKTLKTTSRIFGYAGTKDKRGVTVQRVTAHKLKAERLANMNGKWHGIRFGDFKYVERSLRLGDLKGNQFKIVLRNIKAESEDAINQAMISLKDRGFINYFGMQRFGTSSVSTHKIGIALLREQWEEAVNLVMDPRDGEREDYQKARLHWKEYRDPSAALKLFSKGCVAETSILNAFVKKGHMKDFLGAFSMIPRNLRLMYVHAYQSYIWNKMTSERIRKYGCVPVPGDIVLVKEGDDDSIESEEVAAETVETKPKVKDVKIKILDEKDIADYTIYDVVLPCPGYDVTYPANDIGEMYKEAMQQDGLDPYNMRRNIKDYSLSGNYRNIVSKPGNVSWSLLRYDDPNLPLCRTDLEILENVPEPQGVADGKYLALRLQLTLKTSQYATMALREVIKLDTSSAFQAKLNE
ncbi:uncharacterized protein VTP21DRAFT_3300 [Calcarisporiella thermophila]|uniref:uncharacterized protein n=1 Tax=Calcarisporiella thermophila TaxID=911321 RepID=UPI00374285A0